MLEHEKLGMEVLVKYQIMPVKNINVNTDYQRLREPARERRVTNSIKKHGYWPQEVVILNEKYEAIDGNHRVLGAKKNKIKDIPVSVVTFPNKKKEAEFFTIKNSFNTQLKPVDFWYARYLGEHPYAMILYDMTKNPESLLYNKIAIKGQRTEQSKFAIPSALIFINTAGAMMPFPWNQKYDEIITNKLITRGKMRILHDVNDLMLFFYDCFGKEKQSNPIPYRRDSVRAICSFYHKCRKEGLLNTSLKTKTVIKKIRLFVFTQDFVKAEHVGKLMSLVNHWNKSRRANKLNYKIPGI